MLKNFLVFFADIFETIIVALAVFLLVYFFLIQPHRVQGDSMLPNFKHGELILTDKISFRIREPQIGDVIVFRAPQDSGKDFIKRIVGLPSETIELSRGQILVNGNAITESYLGTNSQTLSGAFLKEGTKVTIGDGEYFVLGDNRNHSSDSREWGTIKKSEIVGRAFIIYWPPPSFALVPQIQF